MSRVGPIIHGVFRIDPGSDPADLVDRLAAALSDRDITLERPTPHELVAKIGWRYGYRLRPLFRRSPGRIIEARFEARPDLVEPILEYDLTLRTHGVPEVIQIAGITLALTGSTQDLDLLARALIGGIGVVALPALAMTLAKANEKQWIEALAAKVSASAPSVAPAATPNPAVA